MRARTKRIWIITASAVLIASAAALTLGAIRQSAMFYYTPSDLLSEEAFDTERTIRLGGMVEEGSLEYGEGSEIRFVVTDGAARMPVRYDGIVPDLFREGQGVVADGQFEGGIDGVFVATRILAKHDENYVPRELRDLDMTGAAGDTATR